MDEDKTRYICNKVKQIGKMKGNIRRLRWIHRVNAGVYYTPRVRYHISYSVVLLYGTRHPDTTSMTRAVQEEFVNRNW